MKASTLLLFTSLLSFPAAAAIINGGFETGNFTGFTTTVGNTFVESAAFGVTPPGGSFQALLVAPDTDFGPNYNLDNFLGLPADTIETVLPSGGPGAGLQVSFNALAGQTLSFTWDFITCCDEGGAPYDGAFVSITGAGTLLQALATTSDATTAFGPVTKMINNLNSFSLRTGYSTFQYIIPVDGVYTLGLGVLNGGPERSTESALLVDDISLTGVPEPSSLLLAATGLALALAAKRRR